MQKYIDSLANEILDESKNTLGENAVEEAKAEIKNMNKGKTKNGENPEVKTERKKTQLTDEERKRRRAILRKRQLLKEKEAKKNVQE